MTSSHAQRWRKLFFVRTNGRVVLAVELIIALLAAYWLFVVCPVFPVDSEGSGASLGEILAKHEILLHGGAVAPGSWRTGECYFRYRKHWTGWMLMVFGKLDGAPDLGEAAALTVMEPKLPRQGDWEGGYLPSEFWYGYSAGETQGGYPTIRTVISGVEVHAQFSPDHRFFYLEMRRP